MKDPRSLVLGGSIQISYLYRIDTPRVILILYYVSLLFAMLLFQHKGNSQVAITHYFYFHLFLFENLI